MTDSIGLLLAKIRTVAVVGLSANPERPSHDVAAYLQKAGFRVVPVNPMVAPGEKVLGETVYPSLAAIPAALAGEIDAVDVFRKSEDVPQVVFDLLVSKIKPKVLWLQLGIRNNTAVKPAQNKGILVIQDKCLKIEHATRNGGKPSDLACPIE
jgi:hypothetical protein